MGDEIIAKGVIPYKDLGNADEGEGWDGPGEVAKAEVEDLKLMCTWFDSENPDLKTAYKLPHHKADGHKAVWRGVANAAARLPQTDMPEGDMAGCEGHLGKHYKDFDKETPWEKMAEDWKKYCTLAREKGEHDADVSELRKQLFPDLNDKEEEEKTAKLEAVIKVADLPEFKKLIEMIQNQYEGFLRQKDEIIAELKSAKLLTREDRKKIAAAIEALKALATDGSEPVEVEVVKSESLERRIKEEVAKAATPERIGEAVAIEMDRLKGKVR